MRALRHEEARVAQPAASALGDRLRQLRIGAGLTQSELAGDRFSKEYVSQIERGKTRPTEETIAWLAARLGVDATFLTRGVSDDERARLEAQVARAEALVESDGYEDALPIYDEARAALAAPGLDELRIRAACGEGKALIRAGRVREALQLLLAARADSESAAASDVQRADVLCKLGVCRYLLSSTSTAIALLNEALAVADGSGLPCDRLRADILHWRSRCYRRQRDYAAAKEDVERALELAEGLNDVRTMAHLYFQASMVAEHDGHSVLARSYAERARTLYEDINDRTSLARLQNNLGGLSFLLGKPEDAVRQLKQAFATALDIGSKPDAARAISSLSQVHLRTGNVELAEQQARQALELLGDRVDFLDEVGNAQLILGRALLEQDRLDEADESLRASEATFDQLSSGSHRASAWIARGDLASRRGDDRGAAALYRQAAETLQDVRF